MFYPEIWTPPCLGVPLQVAVPSTAQWIGAQLSVEIAVLVTCHRSGPDGTALLGPDMVVQMMFELGNHRIRAFEEGIIRNSSNEISEHNFGSQGLSESLLEKISRHVQVVQVAVGVLSIVKPSPVRIQSHGFHLFDASA